jgi:REP-associated tyrosine transposase
LGRQNKCRIVEGYLMPDHVQRCIGIFPKHPVASILEFVEGKSAITLARPCGKARNVAKEQSSARGYAVSTVGFEPDEVCR